MERQPIRDLAAARQAQARLKVIINRHRKVCGQCSRARVTGTGHCDTGWQDAVLAAWLASEVRRLKGRKPTAQQALW